MFKNLGMSFFLPELNIDWYSFSFVKYFGVSPVLTLSVVNDYRVDQSRVILDNLRKNQIVYFNIRWFI